MNAKYLLNPLYICIYVLGSLIHTIFESFFLTFCKIFIGMADKKQIISHIKFYGPGTGYPVQHQLQDQGQQGQAHGDSLP